MDRLLKEIQKVREKGYSYEKSESTLDVECVAVPYIIRAKLFAAMSINQYPSLDLRKKKSTKS